MPRHVLFVDSRKRDLSSHPDPGQYTVDFDEVFRNVESVELDHAIYRKFGTEMVVILSISEINSSVYSNCHAVTTSFAQLPLVDFINEYNGGFTHFQCYRRFRPPLEKLARLTIQFTDVNGEPYKMLDHHLRFSIRTSERNTTVDTRYLERISEPMQPGPALLGLGPTFSAYELHAAYARKRRMYLAEQRSSGDLDLITELYKRLLAEKQ